jgi:hypothetical protein
MTADRELTADHGADQVAGVCLVIERTTTTDCAAGLPWPPLGEHWYLVRRTDGRTTWRRISLDQIYRKPRAAAAAQLHQELHRRQNRKIRL